MGSTLEEPATEGACSSSVTGSGISAITISPSLSAPSWFTLVATSDKEEIRKVPEVHVGSDTISSDATDDPRINFEDGCSLIPSPPPSPAPIPESVRSVALAPIAVPVSASSSIHLEEPKISYLSTSFPPPRTSLSYNDSVSDLGTSPSPLHPLVSFDQHFANQSKIKEYRDSTTPRKVVNGFQPLAAKRLSKPGLSSTSPTPGSDSVPVPVPSNEDTLVPINRFRIGYSNVRPLYQKHYLDLSVDARLDKLRILQQLCILDVSCMNHLIGPSELSWMNDNWPKLKKLIDIS
ncbi:hypothetical protein CPC16_006610 [Podila verticillata]|nr:hypothetical protein CPC16_006610 [Podila verticillata]